MTKTDLAEKPAEQEVGAAQPSMDCFTLARLMGHRSPSVAAPYYIPVTEMHVAAGFGKFVEY